MLLPWYKVRNTSNKGRGVFVTQGIPCGTIAVATDDAQFICTREEFEKLDVKQQDELNEHAFLLPSGLWSDPNDSAFMNHSCDANILGADFFGGSRTETLGTRGSDIIGLAVRDIHAGEEICCDYRQYDEAGVGEMECACGSSTCDGWVNRYPATPELRARWREQLDGAIQAIPSVPQTLREAVLEWMPELAQYFEAAEVTRCP